MKERIKTIVFWILLAFTAAAAMVTPWACANKKENNSEKETMVESQEAAEGTIVGDGAGLNNVEFAKSLDGENAEKAQEQAERSIVRLGCAGKRRRVFRKRRDLGCCGGRDSYCDQQTFAGRRGVAPGGSSGRKGDFREDGGPMSG